MSSSLSRRDMLKTAATATAALGTAGYLLSPNPPTRRRHNRKLVRFWHLLSGQWQQPTETFVEQFNESQTKYEVVPLLVPDTSADSKFLLSVAGGYPPDVMLHWTQAMSVWAEGGILLPLDSFMTPEERKDFLINSYPVIAKSGWYKGHLYGMTVGFDLWVIFYRVDHFKEAGLDPDPAKFPKTLEGVVELGKQLDRFDSTGEPKRLGYLPQSFVNLVPSFGGWFFDEKSREPKVYNPATLGALEFMVKERKRIGFDKVIRFISGLPSSAGTDMPFIGGAYSIMIDGEWRVEHLRKYAPNLEYHTVFVPAPKGGRERSSFSSTNFITIPKGAQEPEGAWEFIRFWTGLGSLNNSAKYYPPFGWMPRGPEATKASEYQEFLREAPQYRTFLELAKSDAIEITPAVTYQLFLMDRITRTDDLATRGSLTPEQALRNLDADVRQERARRKELGYAE